MAKKYEEAIRFFEEHANEIPGDYAKCHTKIAECLKLSNIVTEPVDVGEIKGVVEELTGQIFDPGENWEEALYDHLVTNEYLYQSTQAINWWMISIRLVGLSQKH